MTDHIDEEGYTKKIREPCPVCGGLRLELIRKRGTMEENQ